MARPQSKVELLQLSCQNFQKLIDLVESYPVKVQQTDFPPGTLNRNIRDVLAHLHHWHLMLLEWYQLGITGKKPSIPAPGYTWKTLPELNRNINLKYHQTNLAEARSLLEDSFQQVQKLIEAHSDQELFEKKKYAWTGTTSLGAYLISATSSHYDWAIKLIKKATKPTADVR